MSESGQQGSHVSGHAPTGPGSPSTGDSGPPPLGPPSPSAGLPAGVNDHAPLLLTAAGEPEGLDSYLAAGAADLTNIDMIREGEMSKPYIGDMEELGSLRAEYQQGNQVFVQKIDALSNMYSTMRRTRGDGNCFFRSFIFGYLEWLLINWDKEECSRFLLHLESAKKKLLATGFQDLVFEDAMDLLEQHVQAISAGPTTEGEGLDLEQLMTYYRDDVCSNTVVMLLRLITSAEIQQREAHFMPFVLGQYELDVSDFCRRFVEPMQEESDHIHAQALADAVGVPIRIAHIDSNLHSGGESEVSFVDMQPEGVSPQQSGPARVHLLYRPGHYDILYPSVQQQQQLVEAAAAAAVAAEAAA